MLKRIALTLALLAMPAAGFAQEHSHDAAQKKHEHAAPISAGEHVAFLQLLIEKKAELNLTEEQITKLEAVSAKMAAHHGTMNSEKAGIKHEHAGAREGHAAAESAHGKMHAELMAIFTPEQLEKVKILMKAHKEGICAGGQCKLKNKAKIE